MRRFFNWMGNNARVVLLIVLFIAVIAVLAAAVALNEARNSQVRVNSLEALRVTEERAAIESQYENCKAGIPATKRIDRLLRAIKADYLERATASVQLAQFATGAERALRLQQAARLRRRAATVVIFPVKTLKECQEARNSGLAEVSPP